MQCHMHNKFCNPPLRPLPILIFLTKKKKKLQLLFFSHLVKLGEYNRWQHHCHLTGAHTNYRLPNQQKCEICYQILYVLRFSLLYSTVKSVVTLRESESVQERREREYLLKCTSFNLYKLVGMMRAF